MNKTAYVFIRAAVCLFGHFNSFLITNEACNLLPIITHCGNGLIMTTIRSGIEANYFQNFRSQCINCYNSPFYNSYTDTKIFVKYY